MGGVYPFAACGSPEVQKIHERHLIWPGKTQLLPPGSCLLPKLNRCAFQPNLENAVLCALIHGKPSRNWANAKHLITPLASDEGRRYCVPRASLPLRLSFRPQSGNQPPQKGSLRGHLCPWQSPPFLGKPTRPGPLGEAPHKHLSYGHCTPQKSRRDCQSPQREEKPSPLSS